MRIGVDVYDLKVSETGQKTYIEELSKALREKQTVDCQFVFLDSPIHSVRGKSKFSKALNQLYLQIWKQILLPWKAYINKCDIVFCQDYYTPLIRIGFKTIQVFHDAFFFEYPEHYHPTWLKFYKLIAIPAAKKCSAIVTPTNYSKQRVHQLIHIPEEKLVVIPEGPKSLHPTGRVTSKSVSELQGKKYLLHVGVLDKRKNLIPLIQAFDRLVTDEKYNDLYLVLAGKGSGKKYSDVTAEVQQAAINSQVKDRIILTGYVTDGDLFFLYSHALAYVFPSYNEGFGIPLLEAFRFGLPVAAANNTALPEVGGDAALWFNPFDTNDIIEKLKQLINDEALRIQLTEKGKQRHILFSWQKAAEEYIHLFRKTMENKS